MAKNTKTKKGFTIIEVVLVLAIAGLIFLMVFVALPALQRSQRDTQRRQDLSRVVTALVQYQTNNRTRRDNLPASGSISFPENDFGFPSDCASSSACNFIKNYMNATNATENTFVDPDGFAYNMLITKNYAQIKDAGGLTPLSVSGLTGSKLVVTTLSDGSTGFTIGGDNPFSDHIVYIIPGGECSGEAVVKSELRHFAILYQLEGSGIYCVGSDNQ